VDHSLIYHFVWGPSRAKPCLVGRVAERLRELLRERADELCIEIRDLTVLPDRVYLAVAADPTLSPHRIVCQLKAHSSHCMRHEFREMTKIPTVWTRAYVVVAGDGVSPEQVLGRYEAMLPPRRRPGRPRCQRGT
jgi:putative transposase